jgi:hypothetical protein
MSFLDKFTSKPQLPKSCSEVKSDFTQEEAEAINRSLKMHASIAIADAPAGTEACIPIKAKNAIIAQALAQYVGDLMLGLQRHSNNQPAVLLDKAVKAQMKAYAIHNLPVYLFEVARLFERAGDVAKAKEFFRQFLTAQSTFQPDRIDTLFLKQTGFDISSAITAAKEKLR